MGHTVKVAISTPRTELDLNDETAQRHHMNRSQFYTHAAALYRAELDDQRRTEAINAVIADIGQSEASHGAPAARTLIDCGEWTW